MAPFALDVTVKWIDEKTKKIVFGSCKMQCLKPLIFQQNRTINAGI